MNYKLRNRDEVWDVEKYIDNLDGSFWQVAYTRFSDAGARVTIEALRKSDPGCRLRIVHKMTMAEVEEM